MSAATVALLRVSSSAIRFSSSYTLRSSYIVSLIMLIMRRRARSRSFEVLTLVLAVLLLRAVGSSGASISERVEYVMASSLSVVTCAMVCVVNKV